MAINNEKRQEILVQSFNVLKSEIYNNSQKLREIIEKMLKMDQQLAIEMWIYLMENFKEIGRYCNERADIADWILDSVIKEIGVARTEQLVLNNQTLRKKLYKENASPDWKIPTYLIQNRDLSRAYELLQDVYQNPNHSDPWHEDIFANYLEYLISDLKETNVLSNQETIEFLLEWIEKVNTEQGKANLHVALIDYL